MTLLVKDANTTVQSLATEADGSGNLVPLHAAASVVAGVASPVGPSNPLPVINTAGGVASDGSGTVATGGSPQTLFGGTVPVNGFWCKTIRPGRYGSAIPGSRRTVGQAFSSPAMAGCSRHRPATSRQAR
jgi:hypothetical protein